MKNHNLRLIAALCLLVALLLPMTANAAGNIDMTRPIRLTVSCQSGDTPLAGVEFAVYLVAAEDTSGKLTVTDDFSRYGLKLEGNSAYAWKIMASTLQGRVLRDGIVPVDTGTTNADGFATFPGEEKTLVPGLYLVLGQRHTQSGHRYDPTPFLAFLPGLDEEKDAWVYDVTANAKFDVSTIPDNPEDDTVTRKVLKVWKDEGQEEKRPQEIVVHLLRNGVVYDTVLLSAENNWRYTWENLSADATWLVAEKEPEGYTVEVTREGVTFIVTNTYTEPPSDDTPPSLPQTGQLWWPVPVLLCAGLLCVVIGLLRRRGSEDEKE